LIIEKCFTVVLNIAPLNAGAFFAFFAFQAFCRYKKAVAAFRRHQELKMMSLKVFCLFLAIAALASVGWAKKENVSSF
jgi:hypothetical protein